MFPSLLQYLDSVRPAASETWRGWHIAPVMGGANALVYRVTRQPDDYAVKFTVRDERDRAGREYAALDALRQSGLRIAPEPIWLGREQYTQPVVVQSWLDGETLDGPPQNDAEWAALLDSIMRLPFRQPRADSGCFAERLSQRLEGRGGQDVGV